MVGQAVVPLWRVHMTPTMILHSLADPIARITEETVG